MVRSNFHQLWNTTRFRIYNTMADVKPRVVAVIPCYNTGSRIAEVVTKCLPHVDQVIVVDDGSTDDTMDS